MLIALCYLANVFDVAFCIAWFVVYYLNVTFCRLITSVGEKSCLFLLSISPILIVSIRRSFSSSGCLEKATLFYCGTPWVFHTTILAWCKSHFVVLSRCDSNLLNTDLTSRKHIRTKVISDLQLTYILLNKSLARMSLHLNLSADTKRFF